MAKKTYRPHKDAEDGFVLTFNTAESDEPVEISSWPYEREDSSTQLLLDNHPQITDRPAPKSSLPSRGPR